MTDPIIYEAQPIGPQGSKDGRGRSALFGGIALIVVLLASVALGAALFRGGDEPDPLAEPDPTQPSVTRQSTTTLQSPLADRSESARGFFGGGDSLTRPARPGGGADVGTPTPALPAQEFEWQKVTLDLPEGSEAYLQGVYAVDDAFIAVGMSWSEQGQDIVVWKSTDGITWETAELNGNFSNANIWNVEFSEYGAIAYGEETTEGFPYEGDGIFTPENAPPRLVWTSSDGVNWTRTELDFASGENEMVWINTGVAGPDGFLVVAHRETSPEYPPIVIEKDGYQLTLSDHTYQLLDSAGAVVAEGSMEDIYANTYDEDGQVVFNPETGEILTVVPYETWELAWEEAYSESSGGPFGGYGYSPPIVTIEYDGYRITINEEDLTYVLEDAVSGEVIASGSADYFWRGPAPVINDSDGSEIIAFTWEELDTAQERFWEDQPDLEFEYRSAIVVATSTDGVTWTEATIATDAREVNFDSIIARDDGYLAYGSQYDRYGGGPAIWTSPDGLTWQPVADMPGGMHVWNVTQAHDGTLLAIGDGPQGTALWSSTDGIAWGEAFGTRIPEDRSLSEWLGNYGTGQLGTVVVGSRQRDFYDEEYYSEPFTLTQDEYTLTFDDFDWPPRVTIVDNDTEDVVIDVRLREEGGLPEGFSYEDGVTYIENNGIVLMAITDDDWHQAQEAHWMALEAGFTYEPGTPTMYFSSDLAEWNEVPVTFDGWVSHIAVGSEAVVLAGEEYLEEPLIEPEAIGEDAIYYDTPPTPVLWVGRP